MQKQILGQYYTIINPFKGNAFEIWNEMLPKGEDILEPFAGSGNITNFFSNHKWKAYDIIPGRNDIIQRDTISNFPKNFKICITNPPYLAKNAMKRKGENLSLKNEDLYLDCLELMLENCDYVSAIIPSTYYGTKMFRNRLLAWDKLDYKLFSDTDSPVGVAYFVPYETEHKIYVNGEEIEKVESNKGSTKIKFNVSYGNYIFSAIDKTSVENINIRPLDNNFNRDKFLKHTSRNYSLFYSENDLDCKLINKNITEWRNKTKDFYLTNFKSLMKNGKYRKRMSFEFLKSFI